jgi:hypothetical protein
MTIFSLIIGVLWYITDKDSALISNLNSTSLALLGLITPVLVLTLSHISRKALFDYIDLKEVFEKAIKTPIGSGLVFLGVCLVLTALLSLFGTALFKS